MINLRYWKIKFKSLEKPTFPVQKKMHEKDEKNMIRSFLFHITLSYDARQSLQIGFRENNF